MSKLTRKDVLALAALSKLRLTDEEVDNLGTDLSNILEYVQVLDSVDTKDLEPTYQVTGLKNVMREDKLHDYGYSAKDLLKNAPATKDGQFKVKRVL